MTREQIEDIKIRWLGGRHSAEFERDLLALCDLALRGLERDERRASYASGYQDEGEQ